MRTPARQHFLPRPRPAAGASVLARPTDTSYGSREFAVADPEGNFWSFGTYRGAPVPTGEDA